MAYSSIKVSGRLVVGGTELECVTAAMAFELNGVPRATFTVAVGRGGGNLKPAAIHSVGGSFQLQQPVQFYVTLQHQDGVKQDLPTGEFRLFDGYLTGLSFQRMEGQVQAVLHAKHWLLDMDYSSGLSDTSHPLNPAQFSYKTSHLFQGANSNLGGVSWTPFTQQGAITPETVAEDFWGKGLLPWLREITEQDAINTDELAFLGKAGANTTAAKALSRFTTTSGNYVPLALNMRGADSQAVADAIWNDVQNETFESFANTTLWGKLVSDFSGNYLFGVVPRVEDALVVPFAPGINKQWKHKLMGTDYSVISTTSELSRLLRGVGVFSGVGNQTGCNLREPGDDSAELGIGGWFSPEGVESGMVMLKQGPRWLSQIIASDQYSRNSTGNGGTAAIGTAFHPGVSINADNRLKAVAQPNVLKKQSKPLLDAFAHALYVFEQLRLRQVELGGKLRFDIAPGSTVFVDITGERFIENDALGQSIVGDVMRVTYFFDCEHGRCGTNYNLAHVRTIYENDSDAFGIEAHPLWQNVWSGCGIIEDFD